MTSVHVFLKTCIYTNCYIFFSWSKASKLRNIHLQSNKIKLSRRLNRLQIPPHRYPPYPETRLRATWQDASRLSPATKVWLRGRFHNVWWEKTESHYGLTPLETIFKERGKKKVCTINEIPLNPPKSCLMSCHLVDDTAPSNQVQPRRATASIIGAIRPLNVQ